MTEKPVKPLSERIREAGLTAVDRFWSRSPNVDQRRAIGMHKETLGFLAELAEMMEKK